MRLWLRRVRRERSKGAETPSAPHETPAPAAVLSAFRPLPNPALGVPHLAPLDRRIVSTGASFTGRFVAPLSRPLQFSRQGRTASSNGSPRERSPATQKQSPVCAVTGHSREDPETALPKPHTVRPQAPSSDLGIVSIQLAFGEESSAGFRPQ